MKFKTTRVAIVEIWIIILVILNLGFGKMTDNRYLSSTNFVIALTALSAIILFLLSYNPACRKSRGTIKSLNLYIAAVILLWFVEMIFTLAINEGRFENYSWFLSSTRFFELFLAYPVYYVLDSNKGKKFINTCIVLLMLNLMMRQLSWYLYNFRSVTIFPALLFENENWSRNDIYRCSGTAITLIFFIYLCVQFCKKSRYKYVYLACIIYIIQYTILVFVSRAEFIFECFILIYMLEFQPNRNKYILFSKAFIFMAACVIVTSPPVMGLFSSIVNLNYSNIYAGSTLARFNTIRQCIRMMRDYPLTGVGFYSGSFMSKYPKAIFSDVGVIGSVANMGLLGLTASAGYAALAIKEVRKSYQKYDHLMCMGILLNMVIIGGILVSSFVYQKIFSVPFVIGFIMYIKCSNQRKLNQDK